jgi:hypothetical protein
MVSVLQSQEMTQNLLDIVTYGSYVRIAAPVIPLGVTLYSLYQSLNANTGVFPVWFWILPLLYTVIDAASIPLNIAYLSWTQVPNSELISNLND